MAAKARDQIECSRRGKPQDNGAQERMRRTLKLDALQQPRQTFAAQQRELNLFRKIYNEQPHHAVNPKRPASLYTRSERAYPEDLPDPVYAAHFEQRAITKIGVFTGRAARSS